MTNPVKEHRKFLDEISVRRAKRRRLLQTAGSTSNDDHHDHDTNDNDDTNDRTDSSQDRSRPYPGRSENKTHDAVLRSSYKNYSPGEETIRNDYTVEYIVSGVWNASWIKGVGKEVDECQE
jgi:predicted phage gp36 major capsid-like protein